MGRRFCVLYPHCFLDLLLLDGNIEDYEFLNRSRREIDGVNDRDDWDTLMVS